MSEPLWCEENPPVELAADDLRAFRYGARLYLLAVAAEPTRRGPKPKEQMLDAA